MTNIEVGALVALMAFLFSIGGVAVRNAIWQTRNEASAKAARAIADEAKLAAVDAHRLAASISKDLAEFRAKVAGEYATVQLIDRLEEKLVRAFDRMGDRFDNFLTQNVPNGK